MQQFTLADMYHTAVTVDLKEKVLQSFCSVNGSEWQIVTAIATTAFGLGIDCPDIRRVYHWACRVIWTLMSKKVEGQGEISSKATQSCGMGMCQSIPMQNVQLCRNNTVQTCHLVQGFLVGRRRTVLCTGMQML